MENYNENDIAIVGLGVRLSDETNDFLSFWNKLLNKKDFFIREEFKENFRKVYSKINDSTMFSASRFKIPKVEADFMDPQHRIILELAAECLDSADVDLEKYSRNVGVFTSASPSSYLYEIVSKKESFQSNVNNILNGTTHDNIPTMISYKLDLRGPSLNVGSNCSSSGVAVSLAVQSLLNFQCDYALVASASVRLPDEKGYIYEAGGINSEDGFCRPYSENATGTVPGEGAGVILLKRAEDAKQDNDFIYAIISATGINNDGSRKIGYSAPSIVGQETLMKNTLYQFDIDPSQFIYFEGHGTGTQIGDPVELKSIGKVFKNQKVYLGSLKANLGHADSAATILSIIKVALMALFGQIPPQINFIKPNKLFDWASSSLNVNTEVVEWSKDKQYAGILSLGVGGTNCFIVMKRPLEGLKQTISERKKYFFPIKSQSNDILNIEIGELTKKINSSKSLGLLNFLESSYLKKNINKSIDKAIVYDSKDDKVEIVGSYLKGIERSKTLLVFSGQSTKLMNFSDYYENISSFRQAVDICLDIIDRLDKKTSQKVSEVLLKNKVYCENESVIIQLSTVIPQIVLGKEISRYTNIEGVIGHSLGEISAACVAGIMSIEDAIRLVYFRGKAMEESALSGKMILLTAEEDQLHKIQEQFKVRASVRNSANEIAVSDTIERVNEIQEHCIQENIRFKILNNTFPFHSNLLKKSSESLSKCINFSFRKSIINFYSSSEKNINNNNEFCSKYWSNQMLDPVDFYSGLKEVFKSSEIDEIIEIGTRTVSNNLIRELTETYKNINLVSTTNNGRYSLNIFYDLLVNSWNNITCKNLIFEISEQKIPLPPAYYLKEHFWFENTIINKSLETTQNVKEELYRIYSKYISSKQISYDEGFIEQGGDSIYIISLLNEINQAFNVNIMISDFVRASSIYEVSKIISNFSLENNNGKLSSNFECKYQLKAEKRLKDYFSDFSFSKTRLLETGGREKILLTGATGFVGIHVLKQLLDKGNFVICLERTGDKLRIIDKLIEFDLYDESLIERIEVIKGNLETEYLGLSKGDFKKLSIEVRHIVHIAARVNHILPAEDLLQVNSYSMESLINLARYGRNKKIIYLSTTDVYTDSSTDLEYLDFKNPNIASGYGYSKFIGEKYLKLFSEKGGETTIIRTGNVLGSEKIRKPNSKDAIWNLAKAINILKLAPKDFFSNSPMFYSAKVDELSKIIVESIDKDVLLVNAVTSQPVTLFEYIKAIEMATEDIINPEELTVWKDRLSSLRNQGIWIDIPEDKSNFLMIPNNILSKNYINVLSECDLNYLSDNIYNYLKEDLK